MLASRRLADDNLAPVGPLALEAICARVVHALAARGEVGRFQVVADRPGLPRALARTLEEGVAFKAKLMNTEDQSPMDISDASFATI